MVFVILGTQDKEFPRLIKMVERLVKSGVIKDKVIVQNGNTHVESKYLTMVDFLSPEEFSEYINQSKYIITHGGVGSIINALNHNKKVIAVARLSKYKEHENDHQLQIVREFSRLGFILDGTNDLEGAIKKIAKFKPNKYTSNKDNFIKLITDYIDNTN